MLALVQVVQTHLTTRPVLLGHPLTATAWPAASAYLCVFPTHLPVPVYCQEVRGEISPLEATLK